MVFDAHNRAFAFFGGVPERMVYDNLKAVVETIFTGKERLFNRRFMVLANHYLFEPVARRFGRDVLICDPWHYLPLLERKPGALRNGVPFGEWDLPGMGLAGRDPACAGSRSQTAERRSGLCRAVGDGARCWPGNIAGRL
jgi:hypothetical protein